MNLKMMLNLKLYSDRDKRLDGQEGTMTCEFKKVVNKKCW